MTAQFSVSSSNTFSINDYVLFPDLDAGWDYVELVNPSSGPRHIETTPALASTDLIAWSNPAGIVINEDASIALVDPDVVSFQYKVSKGGVVSGPFTYTVSAEEYTAGDNVYLLTLTVTDADGQVSEPQNITITAVAPPNTAPTLTIPDMSGTFGQAFSRSLGQYADDAESDALTYSMQSGNATYFSISPEGLFEVKSNPPVGSYTITARVQDPAGLAATDTFTFTVGAVAPVAASPQAFSLPENTTAVGTVSVTGGTGPYSFAMQGGADLSRLAVTNAGVVSMVAAPDYEAPTDADGNRVYTGIVRVSGPTGLYTDVTVNVTVTNVIEDVTPAAFMFSQVTNAGLSTPYTQIAAITGVEAGATLTATNGEVSNNNQASWSNSVTYVAGQTFVRVSNTSSAQYLTSVVKTVTVNGVSAPFTITTMAPLIDGVPDPFAFVSISNSEPGVMMQAVALLTGFDAGAVLTPVTFQISNDDRQTWTSLPVVGVPGKTYVRASVTSSQDYGDQVQISGSVNGITATFSVTTKAAPPAEPQLLVLPSKSVYVYREGGRVATLSRMEGSELPVAVSFDREQQRLGSLLSTVSVETSGPIRLDSELTVSAGMVIGQFAAHGAGNGFLRYTATFANGDKAVMVIPTQSIGNSTISDYGFN